MMRSFVSRFAASAAFTIAILTSFGARSAGRRTASHLRGAFGRRAAKVIEACTALIDNPATPEATGSMPQLPRRRVA